MVSRLAGELIDASRGIGVSIRKRNELHKIAEANRAFAHYRWM
jgi:small subunit ribosomal protein S7